LNWIRIWLWPRKILKGSNYKIPRQELMPILEFEVQSAIRQAASDDPRGYLYYTDKQNVSEDIIGIPLVAAVIEGHETHTRTANVTIDLKNAPGLEKDIISSLKDTVVSIPVTQAVIYGWYDNEIAKLC